MLDLAWPWAAAALPLPLFAALTLRPAPSDARVALRVPFFSLLAAWQRSERHRRDLFRLAIAILAWILLVGAACRPQLVGEPLGLPLSGRDLMLAVDISGSMKTRDFELPGQPRATRLAAVKRIAGDFIDGRVGDRVGMILFGTRAYMQVPLTFDRKVVRSLLDEAVIGLAGERTAIGDAIGLAMKHLHDRPATARVLVLLTDGSNTAGIIGPQRAADLAAMDDLRIHVIGVGADVASSQSQSPTITPLGELDEAVLRSIAATTGGRYFRAQNAVDLTRVYASIDQLEPVSKASEVLRPVNELYAWPLAGALALVLVPLVVSAVRSHRQSPATRLIVGP